MIVLGQPPHRLRRSLGLRLSLLFVVAACASTSFVGARATAAWASCSWNIGCEFYSPQEGHTAFQFTKYPDEIVYASWDTYSSFLAIATTAAGSWRDQATVYNSPNGYRFFIFTDKYGCYNHHTGTMWVNCEHFE
jgi:hypothetical protein